MRISSALLAIFLAAGCGKGGKDKSTTGDSGVVTTPSIAFQDSANADTIAGDVHENTILAHKSTNLVLGAIGLAVADPAVREGMMGHSTGGARMGQCWSGPLIPRSSFTLDYTNCAQVAISGGMVYNQDPLGPISLDYKPVAFDVTRKLSGALGFDSDNAVALHWRTYDTDPDLPSMDHRVPMSVELDGNPMSLDFDGGTFMRAVNQNMAIWGVLDFTPYAGDPMQVLVGGTDAASLRSNVDPDEPASMPWNYLSCRCPTAGVIAMEFGFTISEVTFDLDELKVDDDGVDDPIAQVATEIDILGNAELRPVDCGQWEVTYDASGVDLELSQDQVKAAIQMLCDTAVIQDEGRCTALIKAADEHDSFTIKVGPNKIGSAVQDEAATALDTSYCIPT